MALLALALAVLAAAGAALPGDALFVEMGAGLFGVWGGLAAYRRRDGASSRRLIGAGAAALAALALVLCVARYGLIVAALGRLDAIVG